MDDDPGNNGSLFVVSAHAADFVWRAGGAIAVYAERGWDVQVLCLTLGERGESAHLWRDGTRSLEDVKEIRITEAHHAAEQLGVKIDVLDLGDYPIVETPELTEELARRLRDHRPDAILTHCAYDPYNLDHSLASELTLRARMVAQAHGFEPERRPVLGAAPIYAFEPHQPEVCRFTPDTLVDITSVFDKKQAAMAAIASQPNMQNYYRDLAQRRGVQAVRNSGNKAIAYAEAYQRIFPQVTAEPW